MLLLLLCSKFYQEWLMIAICVLASCPNMAVYDWRPSFPYSLSRYMEQPAVGNDVI